MNDMYKIIRENHVVDVVEKPRFITFLSTGHVTVTDKSNAKGIVGSDRQTLYSFTPNKRTDVYTASIEEISCEEFNRLKDLLNSDRAISADTTALEEARAMMIRKLSAICKSKITNGFSIRLADGDLHHFKLTTEDQLNLMMLENQLIAGASTFIYHATEEPCMLFLRDDVVKILDAFKKHMLYHTTYFNTAKQYIKSLVDIEEVNLFTYGMDVSKAATDSVLIQILKNGGIRE